jgi:hypothetical protein
MKKLVIPMILVVLALALWAWHMPASASTVNFTICVNLHDKHCYATIQSAINAAPKKATINIAAGTYAEQVTISGKALTLVGHNTVINAAGHNNGIDVNGAASAGTVIMNVKAENAKLEGILLQNTSNVTLKNSVVEHNDTNLVPASASGAAVSCPGALPFEQMDCGEGIHLLGVSKSTITNNTTENNAGGLLVSDDTGPSFNNVISHNTSKNNKQACGITLAAHAANEGVYGNTVTQNVSLNNGGAGVGMFTPIPGSATYNNVVSDNTVKGNAFAGIAMHSHTAGGNLNGNKIIGNTISNNNADIEAGITVPVGIVVFADIKGGAAPITNTTITNNTVSNETTDVYVGTAQTALALHSNNLLGGHNVMGVDNEGNAGTVNATKNYWGCATGANQATCTITKGKVDVNPVLTTKSK